jgi:hypothetical protein
MAIELQKATASFEQKIKNMEIDMAAMKSEKVILSLV